MNLFFLIVFGFYLVLMLTLIIGWQETFIRKPAIDLVSNFHRKISVIVPYRNEAASLPGLISGLMEQRELPEQFEVIFVNDHSTDQSASIIRERIQDRNNFRMFDLPEGKGGKKHALAFGIENSRGEIIVTTDADCRVIPEWLASIQSPFDDPHIMMAFAGVRVENSVRFFSQLQALEFCSLVGTGAATAGLGFPTMCNGANLVFRKSAFVEVKGYEGNIAIASGDDEFLMRKLNDRFQRSVCFVADPNAVNETKALNAVKEFLAQRLRWAGKWRYNTSPVSKALAVFVLAFQTSYIALWFAPLLNMIDWRFALLLVAFKLAFEFVFLYQVSSFLKVKWGMIHFMALQFLYPLYVVYVGLASFYRSYEWKGRSVTQ